MKHSGAAQAPSLETLRIGFVEELAVQKRSQWPTPKRGRQQRCVIFAWSSVSFRRFRPVKQFLDLLIWHRQPLSWLSLCLSFSHPSVSKSVSEACWMQGRLLKECRRTPEVRQILYFSVPWSEKPRGVAVSGHQWTSRGCWGPRGLHGGPVERLCRGGSGGWHSRHHHVCWTDTHVRHTSARFFGHCPFDDHLSTQQKEGWCWSKLCEGG